MRVLVISDYRDLQATRPEAHLMVGLKNRGLQIDIVTYPGTPYQEFFEKNEVKVFTNHPKKKYDKDFVRFLQEKTRTEKYKIFYLFNSQAIINGLIAARDLQVKVVLYRGYTGNIHWYDPTAYAKYLNPRVDKVVCLADSIKELLFRQRFFDNKKAITINKGHDPAWYQNIIPVSLSEFSIPQNSFVISCMANAREFKGIKYLLKSTYLLGRLPDLHMLLIGRDMDKGVLKDLIEKSPMRAHIHVTGWRNDPLSILASCDCFVLPSIKGEATTKSLLEAMSMGCAPIMTDIPGNRGVVINQKCGLVVPPGDPKALCDAILFYYKNPNERQQHGIAAKEHIEENFHINRTVKETKTLFEILTTEF